MYPKIIGMSTRPGLQKNLFTFLNNDGEIVSLLQEILWEKHPMGPVKNWPSNFKTTLGIIINSAFPMFVFWGKEFHCFYNEAYRPVLGTNSKHPAIGKPAIEVWPEIWDKIFPLISNIFNGGKSSLQQNQLIPIFRNGQIEEAYWTYSYSPINNDAGEVEGVFVACTETTDKEKLIKTLRDNRDELAFAINAADLGTWEVNPMQNKLTVNKRMKSWFGLDEDSDVDLQLAMDIIDIKDRERVASMITKTLDYNNGGGFETDYKIINPISKEARTVRSKGRAFFNEKKEAYSFSGVLMDITREMQSREALIESENNFRKLVEQAPVAICVLKGADLIVNIANKRQLILWDKTFEEVVNRSVFVGVPAAKNQGFEKLIYNVINTGVPYHANEIPVVLPSNGKDKLRYLNLVYEPFRNNQGIIEGVMSLAIDVSDQVFARLTIEEAEERVRLATDAANLGTFDINLLTGHVINTDRVIALFGFEHQVSRAEFQKVIHPDDQVILQTAHASSLITGKLFYEARVVWKDKSIHWIRTEGKVYYKDNKLPFRLLGTVLDITEQKNTANDLIKINQRLAIALEVGQFGSFELDVATGKVSGSDQFKVNYGLSKNATLNYKNILKLIIAPHLEQVKAAIEFTIENRTVINVEYQIKWKDNTFHWIKTSAKALYNQHLKMVTFIGVTADITEQKKQQQQKDDFIGFASHELKTPVTTIKAYSQLVGEMLLQKGNLIEAGMVDKIGIQVKRLIILIADLLDVTKINSGKLPITKTFFNFNQLIKAVVEDMQNTSPKFNIMMDLTETGNVFSDKERLVQVTNNLIGNAIKYSPDNTKIIIHTYVKNKEIVVCVQDFGVGIEKEYQDKLFDQFYRVSGNIQDTFPGLGLGLYISSEIIKQLGGRIWVTSNLGEGANFYFTIPNNTLAE